MDNPLKTYLFTLEGDTVRGEVRIEGITEGLIAMDLADAMREKWPGTLVRAELEEGTDHGPDCECGFDLWSEMVSIMAVIYAAMEIECRKQGNESHASGLSTARGLCRAALGMDYDRVKRTLNVVGHTRATPHEVRTAARLVLHGLSGNVRMTEALDRAHVSVREYFKKGDPGMNTQPPVPPDPFQPSPSNPIPWPGPTEQ